MKTFYVGIKGVIVKDNKILVLRANKEQGRRDIWEMPGGRMDDQETTAQTLQRELLEELPNIKNVQIGNLLSVYRLDWDIDGDKSLFLVFYKVTADFDDEPEISDEHIAYKWVTKDKALELTEPASEEAIKQALLK